MFSFKSSISGLDAGRTSVLSKRLVDYFDVVAPYFVWADGIIQQYGDKDFEPSALLSLKMQKQDFGYMTRYDYFNEQMNSVLGSSSAAVTLLKYNEDTRERNRGSCEINIDVDKVSKFGIPGTVSRLFRLKINSLWMDVAMSNGKQTYYKQDALSNVIPYSEVIYPNGYTVTNGIRGIKIYKEKDSSRPTR